MLRIMLVCCSILFYFIYLFFYFLFFVNKKNIKFFAVEKSVLTGDVDTGGYSQILCISVFLGVCSSLMTKVTCGR